MGFSFGKFMFNGVDSYLKRENHPADTVEAKKSSFDYSGKITEVSLNHGKKLVVVDDAVQVGIAMPNERKEIQSTLSNHKMKANLTAAGGGAGMGYSLYRVAMGDYLYGALGALASLGIAGWGLGRANQAHAARLKWDEPTQQVCDTRRTAGLSFRSLMSHNLKGSHFTSDETQDVFHQSMSQLDSGYAKQLTKSNPQAMQAWVNQFSEENPVQAPALKYAFNDKTVIKNPKDPEGGHWKREDLDKLAEKSRKFSIDLTAFNAATEEKLQEIDNRQALGHAAIHSTDLLAHTLMNGSANTHLFENERAKQTHLRELRSNAHSPSELQRRTQEVEAAHRLDANQAKSTMEQHKLTSSTVAFTASTLSDVYSATQRATLFAARRSEFMKEFPSQVGNILEEYRSTKQPGSKK